MMIFVIGMVQKVLQKLSPFFPGLDEVQSQNFTNVLAALSGFNFSKFCAVASHEKSSIFKAVFISEQTK